MQEHHLKDMKTKGELANIMITTRSEKIGVMIRSKALEEDDGA